MLNMLFIHLFKSLHLLPFFVPFCC